MIESFFIGKKKIIMSTISGLIPVLSAAATLYGLKETVLGPLDIGEGNIRRGIERAFWGLAATNLGARGFSLDSSLRHNLLKYSLASGTSSVAIQGISNCVRGYKQRNIEQILKGGAEAALGFASLAYTTMLTPKTVETVHQASLLTLMSGYAAYRGVKDMFSKQYGKGIIKALLGIGGVALSVLYLYNELPSEQFYTHRRISSFLTEHNEEIEVMYRQKEEIGEWEKLGSGASKIAFTHPDMPGYLIKIPQKEKAFLEKNDDDLRAHYQNVQEAKSLIEKHDYSYLKVPDIILEETSQGPILVEEKFDLVPYKTIPDHPWKYEAIDECKDFIDKSHLCDVMVRVDHNAGFLKGSEHFPRIGIYDFDCKRNHY